MIWNMNVELYFRNNTNGLEHRARRADRVPRQCLNGNRFLLRIYLNSPKPEIHKCLSSIRSWVSVCSQFPTSYTLYHMLSLKYAFKWIAVHFVIPFECRQLQAIEKNWFVLKNTGGLKWKHMKSHFFLLLSFRWPIKQHSPYRMSCIELCI